MAMAEDGKKAGKGPPITFPLLAIGTLVAILLIGRMIGGGEQRSPQQAVAQQPMQMAPPPAPAARPVIPAGAMSVLDFLVDKSTLLGRRNVTVWGYAECYEGYCFLYSAPKEASGRKHTTIDYARNVYRIYGDNVPRDDRVRLINCEGSARCLVAVSGFVATLNDSPNDLVVRPDGVRWLDNR